jgi:hypothetical protein
MTTVSFRELSRNKNIRERWLLKGEPMVLKIRTSDGRHLNALLTKPLLSETPPLRPPKIDFRKYIGAWGKDKKPLTAQQLKDEIKNAWLFCD